MPCDDDTPQPHPCFTNTNNEQKENDYLCQINDLYCWQEQDCKKYTFIDCERHEQSPEGEDPILLLRHKEEATAAGETKETDDAARREETLEKKKEETVRRSVQKVKPKQEIAAVKETGMVPSRPKRQVVNSRTAAYRASAADIFELSKQNPIVAKAQSFLSDPEPSAGRLSGLAKEILQNKVFKTKGGKSLTKNQVQDLLQSIICYCLDKICFNGKDMKKLSELKKILAKLRKEKINIAGIYDYWNMNEVKQYEPALDEKEIKKLFSISVK